MKITAILFLITLFFFLEIYPRILNKKRVNKDYVKSIADGLGFTYKETDRIVGYCSDYHVELLFIVPNTNHLTNRSWIHLSVNYKPRTVFTNQEDLVDELAEKNPTYRWVANCARLNVDIRKNGPTSDEIQKRISAIVAILKIENLEGISEIEADNYGIYWDEEKMK